MRIVNLGVARISMAAVVASLLIVAPSCSSSSSDSTGQQGEAGAQTDPSAVTWCAAYQIINCSCQQCHQSPPLNGAPIPLLTYADTQVPFPEVPTKKVWEEMLIVIRARSMPYTGDPAVMPPVKPLTDEQQSTLLTWLQQGAHDEGGQDCPQSCTWPKAGN